MTVFQPSDAVQAAEIVAWAAAESQSLEIVAGGSKRGLGRPPRAAHRLDVSRMAGIVDYEPAELILTARAATPMAEIEAELEAKRQMLAFEPADWRGLVGAGGEPTLGGVLACNLAGPRRVRVGSARDYFLGFSAINGWGEVWKAGGKVVKNVTGYDMCKLQAGAFGTLSVLAEVTLKVMPKPETACTMLLQSMADEIAVPQLSQALNSPYEVSAAAHLSAAVARRSGVAAVAEGLGAVTALRLEGPAPSVAFRANAIEFLLGHGIRLDAAAIRAALERDRPGAAFAGVPRAIRLAALPDADLRARRDESSAGPVRFGRGFLRLGRRPHLAQPRGQRSGTGWRSVSGAGCDGSGRRPCDARRCARRRFAPQRRCSNRSKARWPPSADGSRAASTRAAS